MFNYAFVYFHDINKIMITYIHLLYIFIIYIYISEFNNIKLG